MPGTKLNEQLVQVTKSCPELVNPVPEATDGVHDGSDGGSQHVAQSQEHLGVGRDGRLGRDSPNS
jgi:hypothetical protein